MSKILIHFPVILSLCLTILFALGAVRLTPWAFIPAWQALCIAVMLIIDGKNRERRYRKILGLLNKGHALESLPGEHTICGFFIRRAAVIASKPAKRAG